MLLRKKYIDAKFISFNHYTDLLLSSFILCITTEYEKNTAMVYFSFRRDHKARGHNNLQSTADYPGLDLYKRYFQMDSLYFRVNQ